MYILFILFFASLIGITIMLGRKVMFLRNGKAVHTENMHPFIPDLQKIKYVIVKNTKRGIYATTVVTVRFYIRSGNAIKDKYGKIKIMVENKLKNRRKQDIEMQENKESKFLKMISNYKHKIRHIKKKIEEENGKIK